MIAVWTHDRVRQEELEKALLRLAPVAADSLIAALEGSSLGVVRALAARLLGESGDNRAVEPLVRALRDYYCEEVERRYITGLPDYYWYPVVEAAGKSLAKLADPRALRPLIDAQLDVTRVLVGNPEWQTYAGFLQSLAASIGRESDPAAMEIAAGTLVVALKDPDSNVRRSAARALGALGDLRTVEPLLRALESRGIRARSGAALALGELGDIRAVEPLLTALEDSHSEVRDSALNALRALGDIRAVEPLLGALEGRGIYARSGAALALGELADTRAVEPLLRALEDSHSEVRSSAAWALGALGDIRAVEPLLRARQDSESEVRDAAIHALIGIGGPETERAVSEHFRPVVGACEVCSRPLRVKRRGIRPTMRLTCKCGHMNVVHVEPSE